MKPNDLTKQIETLEALKRLAADPVFQEHVQKPMDAFVKKAHAELVRLDITGSNLETVRAGYVTALSFANAVPEKIAALKAVIHRKQDEAP
jgi:hypothetical protein